MAGGGVDQTLAAERSLDPAPSRTLLEGKSTGAAGRGRARPSIPSGGARVGRYVVVSTLGSGAMGVVLAAYDPQLDRKVALKLLKLRGGDLEVARARLQREAQALARLSHPNVVAVHDVGTHDEQVFVAMELVAGRTLRRWLQERPRPWPEVVEVIRAAGQGLAAAHEVGLVHRDFKPDNVMVGDDGRVRVMDFGLVRVQDGLCSSRTDSDEPGASNPLGSLTHTGSLMGTPAYMSPEQFGGAAITAATDQYSLCVTLYEALYGRRPCTGTTVAELAYEVTSGTLRPPPRTGGVPAWLRRIVQRGLARRPEDRFESMRRLLAELSRGELLRRRRRQLLGVGAVAVAIASGVGGWRYAQALRAEACEAEGDGIDELWNDDVRAQVREGFRRTGLPHADDAAERAVEGLDPWADAWREHAAEACTRTTIDESWEPRVYDRARWCLEQHLDGFRRTVGQVVEPGPEAVRSAAVVVTARGSSAECLELEVLAGRAEPPAPRLRPEIIAIDDELARAARLGREGAYDDALEVIAAARARASELGWASSVASAHQREARMLIKLGRLEEAEAAGVDAYLVAARDGAWDVAAEAATELVFTVGNQLARHQEGLRWAEHATIAIAHAGDPHGHREAERLTNLGSVLFSMGEHEQALARHQEALARWESGMGPEHLKVALALNNMATALWGLDRLAEADEALERVVSIREARLGPGHPMVANAMNNLGRVRQTRGMHDEALPLLMRAREIWIETLGPEHPNVAMASANLGLLHAALGELEQAHTWHERALELRQRVLGPEHLDVGESSSHLGRLELQLGRPLEALARFERARSIRATALGPDHPRLASAIMDLGEVELVLGDPAAARDHYAQALAILGRASEPGRGRIVAAHTGSGRALAELGEHAAAIEHLEEAVELRRDGDPERLASARFELARVLWDAPVQQGGDRARARTLVEEARTQAAASRLEELGRWLAEHPAALAP